MPPIIILDQKKFFSVKPNKSKTKARMVSTTWGYVWFQKMSQLLGENTYPMGRFSCWGYLIL